MVSIKLIFALISLMLITSTNGAPLMANLLDVSVPFPSANIARHQLVQSRPLPVSVFNYYIISFLFLSFIDLTIYSINFKVIMSSALLPLGIKLNQLTSK
jgi:hypothetical protein